VTVLQIIFMGTPDFAVPSLKKLHESGQEPALVVCQPDRPRGRGRKVLPPPVKQTAQDMNIEVIQPASVKAPGFIELLTDYAPDLFIVVAFGQVLPKALLEMPRLGTVNVHASLLPKYRGPAPIQWAIINGERKTGVTTMFMDEGLDTGDILLTAETGIEPDDTAATLHDRLANLGADLLLKTLRCFEDGSIKPIPQQRRQATYAPLLKKEDGRIDWEKPAQAIDAFVRGMTPWPGAFTFHDNHRLKIYRVQAVDRAAAAAPGTVLKGFADELLIATGKGVLSILEIQGASGKRLSIPDFLRGYPLPPGSLLR